MNGSSRKLLLANMSKAVLAKFGIKIGGLSNEKIYFMAMDTLGLAIPLGSKGRWRSIAYGMMAAKLPEIAKSIEDGVRTRLANKKIRKKARYAARSAQKMRFSHPSYLETEIAGLPQPAVSPKKISNRPSEAEIKDFYNSWDWKKLSYQTKLDRGRKCECCGATAPKIRIVTDHVKPLRHFWHLRLDPKNLQVLCDDCNMGKGSHDRTDWREENSRTNVVEFPDAEERITVARKHLGEA